MGGGAGQNLKDFKKKQEMGAGRGLLWQKERVQRPTRVASGSKGMEGRRQGGSGDALPKNGKPEDLAWCKTVGRAVPGSSG